MPLRAPACGCAAKPGPDELNLLYDPQPSGGLLIAAPRPEELVARLHGAGIAHAALIGTVHQDGAEHILLV